MWQNSTPLVFVVASATDPDYVRFFFDPTAPRCNSPVGRQGGEQRVYCRFPVAAHRVAHEIGHAIGFFHEQARADRDQMVAISAVALRDEPKNYERLDNELMFGPYDFASIMHYPVNILPTDRVGMTKLIPPDGTAPGCDNHAPLVLPVGCFPSPEDVEAVRFMYGIVPPLTPIAAHHRHENHMEVWVVNAASSVLGAWFDDGSWHTWYSLGFPADTPGFDQRSHLAALGRSNYHMEVWGTARDGQVYGIWWNGDAWQGWYSLGSPMIATLPPGTPIAALSRNYDHMEIWLVANDHRLYGNWWNGNAWQGWYSLGSPNFPPGAHVAALSRNDNHMEVWAVGDDHFLHGAYWVPGQEPPWTWYSIGAPPDPGNALPPGSPLAALTRNDNHMEVWCGSEIGRLWGVWWDGTKPPPNQWQPWYEPDPGMRVPRLSPLAALSRRDDRMEVWCVAPDNPNPAIPGVQSVWYEDGPLWNPFNRIT
jgi:hypothetical protein